MTAAFRRMKSLLDSILPQFISRLPAAAKYAASRGLRAAEWRNGRIARWHATHFEVAEHRSFTP